MQDKDDESIQDTQHQDRNRHIFNPIWVRIFAFQGVLEIGITVKADEPSWKYQVAHPEKNQCDPGSGYGQVLASQQD